MGTVGFSVVVRWQHQVSQCEWGVLKGVSYGFQCGHQARAHPGRCPRRQGALWGPCGLGYTPFVAIRNFYRRTFLNPGNLPKHTQDDLDD